MAGADLFDSYFRRADLDRDGRITGVEAVAFFQGSNLPKQVLAQIWTYADQQKTGFLGRNEFYNALKLVTVAQSKRELTPDIVKAALFGPASAKIPAPQINLAAIPAPPPNPSAGSLAPQVRPITSSPSQSMGGTAPQAPTNLNMGQQNFPSQVNQLGRPPRPAPATTSFHPQQGGTGISSTWGGTPTLAGQTTPVSARGITPSTSPLDISSAQTRPQVTTVMMQPSSPKSQDATLPSSQAGAKDSKSPGVLGNGFASNFGDGFSATASPPKQETTVSSFPASGFSVSSATVPPPTRVQTAARPNAPGPVPIPSAQQLMGNQHQQSQSIMKGNQQVPGQNSSTTYGFASGPESQVSWPRMTPADVQKYNKVFVEVDSDKDGKITGEQARNLFLSWRLPREILMQVWDLSDQDNDSMLSLREFCIALYLMERHREGRPLPRTLPNGIMVDEALLSASGRQAASYGNTAWRPTPGLQHPQVTPAARPPIAPRAKPPAQAPLPLPEEVIQSAPQKSKVPVLEKHLVNQLSEQEQTSLNTKFNEATEANIKVEELEKEIVDSRKKIEYFRTKMQELVLYKSRCDNRLNEITERTSMDKREVESLAKKYEEKYKQSGDVASKLSIEEATFRDIQEQKMDLYRSIVKMEQDGKPESVQVNANKILSELEELMKSVNERCKTYGLRGKPTTLVELPFGWQPGLQEGAADWDENWDKFEDEGFTFVKELTLDVQNVIAPPKEKSSSGQSKAITAKDGIQDASLTNGNHKTENMPSGGEVKNGDAHGEDGVAKTSPESPTHVSTSPSEKFKSDPSEKELTVDGSPRKIETQSEHEGAESIFSEDKTFNEPSFGTFDSHYDTDSSWKFGSNKEFDMGSSFFDSGDLGLPPIRIDSSHKDGNQQKNAPVFDSVPSTPQTDNLFQNKSTYTFDSVPSTPQTDSLFQNKSAYTFDSFPSTPQTSNLFGERSTFAFDSVPSTPVSNNLFPKKSAFAFDSIPNTPQADYLYQNKSAFAFDSVPSTPVYNYNSNSPRRLSDSSELNTFDSFSRFDSFNASDSGLFPPRDSLSRFDSFNSTRESDYGQGFSSQDAFSRFDSFRSTTKDSSPETFSRFDSFQSSTKDSDSGVFPSRDYAKFDSFRSTSDGDHGLGFNTFDDSDPFGSSGPFKTSFDSQTPRKNSDNWKAF